MYLERCKDQPSRSLDEFYEAIAREPAPFDRIGRAMLDLLARLRAVSDARRIWGLTSHERLCLLAEDSYESPWFVIVGALGAEDVFVEYLVPADEEPWPHAYLRGQAASLDDAVRVILIAMDKSRGWEPGASPQALSR